MQNKKFQFHFGFGAKIENIHISVFEEPSFQEAVRKAYAKLSYLKGSTGESWKILKAIDSTCWELLDE